MTQDCCQSWWSLVHSHYTEEQRHYHTLSHIHDMCLQFDRYKGVFDIPLEVALAIFFHDIIYDPHLGNNEQLSAEVFQRFADEALTEESGVRVANVCHMILATETHLTEEHTEKERYGSEDLHYMLDIDMAVLGRDEGSYDVYSASIRKEYAFVPEQEYKARRAQVLERFLSRQKIYCTKVYHQQYEDKARSNVTREIKYLKTTNE